MHSPSIVQINILLPPKLRNSTARSTDYLSPLQEQYLLRLAHDPQLRALRLQRVPRKLVLEDEVPAQLGQRHRSLHILGQSLHHRVELVQELTHLIVKL